jgi:hypothetical protein
MLLRPLTEGYPMRASWRVAVVVLVVLSFVLGTAAAPRGGGRKAGLFAPLEVGQKVGLKERAGGYEIGVVPGVPLGHKVLEVGVDYVVLEDFAGVTETRIPVYAVRAVVVTRLPKEK